MRIILVALLLASTSLVLAAQEQMWVTSDDLNRRTCPAVSCGIVGTLMFRESAQVFERKADWVRITQYYDASCKGGRSEYVASGNAACVPSNGIEDGRFAEWVSAKYLSARRPADPAENAQGTAKLIGHSDDFAIHQDEFVKATERLLASGTCTAKDLTDVGGWMRSTSRGSGVYFTLCRSGSDRIYLDIETGRTFR
ncbi:hypothetical protein HW532_19025 [Kaustia mangrovi]|uniref:DUF3011 domain-containing protein n=1 Tax=Kaustia mangrovi TaxID=2593653 RepID=A0A7S8HDL5_9HYPH|nr:hypothetical protein [Kaustia mangrovi]QPC44609.1 hypothetical protein HW532_19025 [Kaustia mangrovi]